MVIFKNKNCSTEWIPDYKVIINHWKGIVNEKEFTEAMTFSISFMEENGIKHYVADRIDLEFMWMGWQDWAAEHLAPTVSRLESVKNYIIVDQHKNFAALVKESFEDDLKHVDSTLNIINLDSRVKLAEWLKKSAALDKSSKQEV